MVKFLTENEEETKTLGELLGKKLRGGEILALSGTLGGGKTTFVRGLARGLGLRQQIKSPTFVIMQNYSIPRSKLRLQHLDLYRLKSARDLRDLGFAELLADPQSIIAVEWPERAKNLFPKRTIQIKFTLGKKANQRRITIT